MKKVVSVISTAANYVAAVILILVTIITLAQVVERFVFHSAIRWAEEFSAYALVVMTYIAAAPAVFNKSHTRIDFVVRMMPPKVQKYVEAFTNTVCAVYMGILAYYTVPVIKMNMKNLSPVMRVPNAVLSIAVLIGTLLMILFFLYNAYEYLRSDPASEAKGGSSE